MSKKLYHTFISDVISGKKLSCKFVKQSVDRHVNDLKKKDSHSIEAIHVNHNLSKENKKWENL